MKIIVKDEEEKKEFLKMCQYLHDFSVFFHKMRKRNRVDVVRSWDGSIKSDRITEFKKYCGVSLDHGLFTTLDLFMGLADAPDDIIEDIIKETIIIQDHKNKYQPNEPIKINAEKWYKGG
jgi:uncharacterized protein YciU (UPF0263 family)